MTTLSRRFLFAVVFAVFITVVVNGVTMAPLMRLLKMTDLSDDRKFMLNAAKHKLNSETREYVRKLKQHKIFKLVSWGYVGTKQLKWGEDYPVQDPEKGAWLQVLHIERASYNSQFHSGRLPGEVFLQLEALMATLNARAGSTGRCAAPPRRRLHRQPRLPSCTHTHIRHALA